MKNTILSFAFCLIVPYLLMAQADASKDISTTGHKISVEVVNLRTDKGKVMIQILDEAEQPITGQMGLINDGKSFITFNNIPAGKYAIRYFHDENDNGEMDFNKIGIPKEGYGYSNNARGFFGPPDFDDIIFELDEDLDMRLKTIN